MDVTVTFRNMDPTEALKDHAVKKVQKLTKYISHPISAQVILIAEQHKNHTAEINISSDGSKYTGLETTTDMYASIDEAVRKIETQMRKHKDRAKGHKLY